MSNKKTNKIGLIVIGSIILLLIIGIALPSDPNKVKNIQEEFAKKKEQEAAQAKETPPAPAPVSVKPDYPERIEKLLADMDANPYYTRPTTTALVNYMKEMNERFDLLKAAEISKDSASVAMAKKLSKALAERQKKDFPRMREDYLEAIKHDLWRLDIDVNISGASKKTIKFAGWRLANNASKEDFQKERHTTFNALRFTRVEYRMYKEQDEYTYWKVESPKDEQLIKISI